MQASSCLKARAELCMGEIGGRNSGLTVRTQAVERLFCLQRMGSQGNGWKQVDLLREHSQNPWSRRVGRLWRQRVGYARAALGRTKVR